jgi:geranylgeranyl diphosphate synthase type II
VTDLEGIRYYLQQQRSRVDRELDLIIPPESSYPFSIHRAMRYSVFAGGKRLRSILCMESGRLLGGDEAILLRVGSSLELVHTYSLIHDDLPALDNDDLRRGKPTAHRAFGEALAILAGDALLTLAFETLTDVEHLGAECRLRLIRELARAIGTRAGMVAGQVVDLESAGEGVDAATLEFIHTAKTGAFIRAAIRMGALAAGASEDDLDRLSAFGDRIGLAFQIADDLLDVLGTQNALGKTVHKDGRQKKATYPGRHGVEESERQAGRLIAEACELLEPYAARADRLRAIARYVVARTS